MLLLTTYSAFSVGGNLWGLAFPPHSGQRGADRQHTECKPEVSSGTKDAQHYHGLNFLNQTRGLSPLFSSCWTSTMLHLGFGPLQERHQMEESSVHGLQSAQGLGPLLSEEGLRERCLFSLQRNPMPAFSHLQGGQQDRAKLFSAGHGGMMADSRHAFTQGMVRDPTDCPEEACRLVHGRA